MGKSKAPPPPDYKAAAKEQGEQNITAAQQTAALNRPSQIDDNGSQTWALKEGADAKNPQAGDWIVTNKLNDTQKALKDQQDALSGQYAGLAQKSLTSIGSTLETKFDTSGLPQASSLTKDGLTPLRDTPTMQMAPGVAQRTDLSTDGMRDFGSVGATTESSRQRITDALYGRQTALLDPQTKQQSSDLTSRLAAQGITEGSEAYNRAVDNQSRQQSEMYAAARNDAILAGGNEDSRIGRQNLDVANFNNSTRQQQFGERATVASFNNNNRDQEFSQGMASAGFNNGANVQGVGLDAAKRAQEFGENQAVNLSENQLHQNSVAEALQQRQLGLNEANALRTGNQVGGYNFQAYGGGGQIDAAPVYAAAGDGYKAQMDANNANNANKTAMFKGLTSLGGMAMGGMGG